MTEFFLKQIYVIYVIMLTQEHQNIYNLFAIKI